MKAYAYLLECGDGRFYSEWSETHPEERVKIHNDGKGPKYTQRRLPVKLVYMEEFDTLAKAAKREDELQILKRPEKIKLIEEYNRKKNS